MIEFNCKKCGRFYKIDDSYSGKSVRCKNCENVMTVPLSPGMSFGYFPDITLKSDGITPDFDGLFEALAEEERTAPPLASC